MKDFKNIQQLWSSHEEKLQQQWNINVDFLRKINLDKIERKMKSLIWIKSIALGFYMVVAFLLIGFIVNSWPNPYLVVSGTLITVWAFSVCYTSMKELEMIISIDYADSIVDLQQQLLKLRSSIIKYLRLGVWVFPLHLAFTAVFFNLLFGIDIIRIGNQAWIISQVLISVLVMVPLAIWAHRKLVPENADKKWMYSILKGNGTQIIDSIKLLKELEDNEQNG